VHACDQGLVREVEARAEAGMIELLIVVCVRLLTREMHVCLGMQKRAAAVEEKRAAQAKKTGKSSWQHHIMGGQIAYTEWALFDTAGGRGTDILSGRDLFQFDPTLFVDDDDAEQVS